jgi:hypothetical protein
MIKKMKRFPGFFLFTLFFFWVKGDFGTFLLKALMLASELMLNFYSCKWL